MVVLLESKDSRGRGTKIKLQDHPQLHSYFPVQNRLHETLSLKKRGKVVHKIKIGNGGLRPEKAFLNKLSEVIELWDQLL